MALVGMQFEANWPPRCDLIDAFDEGATVIVAQYLTHVRCTRQHISGHRTWLEFIALAVVEVGNACHAQLVGSGASGHEQLAVPVTCYAETVVQAAQSGQSRADAEPRRQARHSNEP